MASRLRHFLVLLLLVTLPLQSGVAAGMLGCPPQTGFAGEPVAAGDTVHMGCHEAADDPEPRSTHDCTHCTVCMIAHASALPALWFMPVLDPAGHGVATLPPAYPSAVPDLPERPPRPVLA